MFRAALSLIVIAAPAVAQRKQANPLDHLPNNVEILTYFGERADISPLDHHVSAGHDESYGFDEVTVRETAMRAIL